MLLPIHRDQVIAILGQDFTPAVPITITCVPQGFLVYKETMHTIRVVYRAWQAPIDGRDIPERPFFLDQYRRCLERNGFIANIVTWRHVPQLLVRCKKG